MTNITSASARALASQASRGDGRALGTLLRAIVDGTVTIADGDFDTLTLGGTQVTSSAAELNILDGATATPTEINRLAGGAHSVGFTPAAGAANVCEVTLQVKKADGTAATGPFNLDVWLSDAATGVGLTATTASGAVAAKASSGTDLGTLTTKKALRVQTLANGSYILSITDTSKTGFYVCAAVPGTGKPSVSSQLVTGNYG
jgi:hypothetical protein